MSSCPQFMIIGFGSLAASTPYLGLILLAIVGMWIYAAKVRGVPVLASYVVPGMLRRNASAAGPSRDLQQPSHTCVALPTHTPLCQHSPPLLSSHTAVPLLSLTPVPLPSPTLAAQDLDWRFAEAQEEMARAAAAEAADSGDAPAAAETKPASA